MCRFMTPVGNLEPWGSRNSQIVAYDRAVNLPQTSHRQAQALGQGGEGAGVS
jgi:hypothetical protein